MRTLTNTELNAVGGGNGTCSSDDAGNDYGGIVDTKSVGDELIEIYEGVVAATSHIIERVAEAL